MAVVYLLEHDDVEFGPGNERTGYAYLRGVYAIEKAAIGDLPNALAVDHDGSHWSPGPHTAKCCSVRPVSVLTAPAGETFVQDWWRVAR